MPVGTVKWFDDRKGYGFVVLDGSPDVFVHHTQIVEEGYRSLAEGPQVEFELLDSEKGPKATKVRKMA